MREGASGLWAPGAPALAPQELRADQKGGLQIISTQMKPRFDVTHEMLLRFGAF
jgi:hypothetical protein